MWIKCTRRVVYRINDKDEVEAEAGEVRDVPLAEAERMIARNWVEPCDAPSSAPPTAETVAPPEQAVQARARGRPA